MTRNMHISIRMKSSLLVSIILKMVAKLSRSFSAPVVWVLTVFISGMAMKVDWIKMVLSRFGEALLIWTSENHIMPRFVSWWMTVTIWKAWLCIPMIFLKAMMWPSTPTRNPVLRKWRFWRPSRMTRTIRLAQPSRQMARALILVRMEKNICRPSISWRKKVTGIPWQRTFLHSSCPNSLLNWWNSSLTLP